MSHVVSIELEINDLPSLKAACAQLGLEFREGQQQYKWYGRHVGDYPLPQGFKKTDLGTCEHAISVPGNAKAYEIGVVKRRDGKAGYILLYDFFAGGYGLIEKVGGEKCERLTQEYAVQRATKEARRLGYSVQRKQLANGKVQLVASA